MDFHARRCLEGNLLTFNKQWQKQDTVYSKEYLNGFELYFTLNESFCEHLPFISHTPS